MKNTIVIIGAGNMGSAFAHGLISSFPEIDLRICDKHEDKMTALDQALQQACHGEPRRTMACAALSQFDASSRLSTGSAHCDNAVSNHKLPTYFSDPKEALREANIVLLAVKPQSAQELLTPLSKVLQGKLIISIMAGISIEKLQGWTGTKAIVRAMPNLPAKVGLGLTGWIASEEVTKDQRIFVAKLFSSVGKEIELTDESMMDALTALSGSGPAYFFLLSELLAAKAETEGFTKEQASLLVSQTLIGSSELLKQSAKSPAEWRAAVTSKGGTTAAALQSFQDADLELIVSDAVDAAITRSRELNK
ncbi:MAG: pyrroline-5-carboxylate reductase [Candidatus Peregrinibacteria bacterium]